jgi:hypothetical protein
MREKEENNVLIAEFMEVDQVDIDTWLDEHNELRYHTSWDWLMPVIAQLREKALILENFDENEHTIHGIEDSIWKNDIKSAYHLVVTAIIEHKKATE